MQRSVKRDLRYENCSGLQWLPVQITTSIISGTISFLELVGNRRNAVRDVQVANDEHQHCARCSTPAWHVRNRLLSAFFPTHTQSLNESSDDPALPDVQRGTKRQAPSIEWEWGEESAVLIERYMLARSRQAGSCRIVLICTVWKRKVSSGHGLLDWGRNAGSLHFVASAMV